MVHGSDGLCARKRHNAIPPPDNSHRHVVCGNADGMYDSGRSVTNRLYSLDYSAAVASDFNHGGISVGRGITNRHTAERHRSVRCKHRCGSSMNGCHRYCRACGPATRHNNRCLPSSRNIKQGNKSLLYASTEHRIAAHRILITIIHIHVVSLWKCKVACDSNRCCGRRDLPHCARQHRGRGS